jgi:hypothetical protein
MTSDTSQPLRGPAAGREVRELGPLLEWTQPLTTTPRDALINGARPMRAVLRFGIPDACVECGSWRGGAGFLTAITHQADSSGIISEMHGAGSSLGPQRALSRTNGGIRSQLSLRT